MIRFVASPPLIAHLFAIFIYLAIGNAYAGSPSISTDTNTGGDLNINIIEVTSSKGIKAWLVEDHSIQLTSMYFSFKGAGSALDPKNFKGISRLISATIDEGAGDLDSQDFQKILTDKSITLRFNVGRESFSGRLLTLSRYKDQAFDLAAQALNHPRFDDEPVARIKASLISAIERDQGRPQNIAGDILWQKLFKDHSYAFPSSGTIKGLNAITPGDLKSYHKQLLTKDRLIIGVSGDITPDELKEKLDMLFGDMPQSSDKLPLWAPSVTPKWGQSYLLKRDIPQTQIAFAHPGLLRSDPDFYTNTVLNHIIGGGTFTSILPYEIREKRGWAYSVATALHPMHNAALWLGWLGTRNETAFQSTDIIREQWQKIADGHISEEQIQAAIEYITGSFPLRFTSLRGVSSWLVSMQNSNLDRSYMFERNSLIKSVSRKDIIRLADKLLRSEDLTFVYVGNPSGFKEKKELIILQDDDLIN